MPLTARGVPSAQGVLAQTALVTPNVRSLNHGLCVDPEVSSESTTPCVARRQNTQPQGQHAPAEIFFFTEFLICSRCPPPHPGQRGVSRSSRTWDEPWWTQATPARLVFAGRVTVSGYVARTTGAARVRQNRVVLTPGVCASSLAEMGMPDRACTSGNCKATGAIVHRSPGRARHKP